MVGDRRIRHPEAGPKEPSADRWERSFLERQRALLRQMLDATREQRRHLVEGNLRGIESTNRRLSELIGERHELALAGAPAYEAADEDTLAELRALASELQRESQVNYTLACRGAELASYSLALLSGSAEAVGRPPCAGTRPEGAPHAEGRPQIINRPA